MLHDLFVNMAILISYVSLGSQLFKKYDIDDKTPVKVKIILGLITGLLGITLMIFTIRTDNKTLLDFRNIALMIAVYFGGTIPVIICSLIISFFRIIYFGINLASILGVTSITLIALGLILLKKANIKNFTKWLLFTLYCLVISSIMLGILLSSKAGFYELLMVYWLSTIFVSIVIYNYVSYCFDTNSSFRKLKMESSKDFLTGLNNVRQFDSSFNAVANQAIRKNESLSLLMIDIDFFKKVNDTYGHSQGDIVLIELGKILLDSCRSYDIVSRNGGEEFTVLLINCPMKEALIIAEKIRHNVESHVFVLSGQKKINVTVSIGVATFPDSTDNFEQLLETSDVALYNAKRTGRNKVCTA